MNKKFYQYYIIMKLTVGERLYKANISGEDIFIVTIRDSNHDDHPVTYLPLDVLSVMYKKLEAECEREFYAFPAFYTINEMDNRIILYPSPDKEYQLIIWET